jgi:hypothetical protein
MLTYAMLHATAILLCQAIHVLPTRHRRYRDVQREMHHEGPGRRLPVASPSCTRLDAVHTRYGLL